MMADSGTHVPSLAQAPVEHSLSSLQPRHAPDGASQKGFVGNPAQSAVVLQGPQVFASRLHTGSFAPHEWLPSQSTQSPCEHAG